MYSIDLSFVIISTIFILLYNPIMTAMFIRQRYRTDAKIWNLSKEKADILIFTVAFIGQFIFAFFDNPSIWWVIYFVTITILFVLDRITKRSASKIHKR